jgi:hypothetical protein
VTIAAIALGSALGSVLRYLMANAAPAALERLGTPGKPRHVVEWPARVLAT